jgi:hypothetical protein
MGRITIMTEIYTLDRIEGDIAVLVGENGESVDIAVSELGENTAVGNVFERTESGYEYSENKTASRRERIVKRTRNMFE